MSKYIHGRSTFWSLLFNGKINHVLNPWNIIVDMNELTLTVKKRNWFLIGFDSQKYSFRYIRSVSIDTHLFGADITIKVMGAQAKAFCISKKIAKEIEEVLIEYDNQKGGKHFIFH